MGLNKPTPEEVDDLAVKLEQGQDVENLVGTLINRFGKLKGRVFELIPNGEKIVARRIKQYAT